MDTVIIIIVVLCIWAGVKGGNSQESNLVGYGRETATLLA